MAVLPDVVKIPSSPQLRIQSIMIGNMNKHQKLYRLVEESYAQSQQPFAQWMWKNHVPIVTQHAERLSKKYGANLDLSIAGALLHDFGDVFVHRHSTKHEEVSKAESVKLLKQSDYSDNEIHEVLEKVIAPHSCKEGLLPTTLEGKVLATADALAHLTTDFYLQFSWMHLPEGKTYDEFISWVVGKIDRDFNDKIFFSEIRAVAKHQYRSLLEVFSNNQL